MAKNGKLRIIAGEHRSRIIQFREAATLRPTSDKLRETLFNWLSAKIINAHCLDLFAGSGILGFEALSRGAAHCTFIEFNNQTTRQLHITAEQLKFDSSQLSITTKNGIQYLNKCSKQFDVIFLDPPYESSHLLKSLRLIIGHDLLKEDGVIYAEHSTEQEIDLSILPIDIIKQNKSGSTVAYLIAIPNHNDDTTDTQLI